MDASSSNGSSSSGSGLGGRRICGVQDSASTIGLSDVDCCRKCGRSCRDAAEANDFSNGLPPGNEEATGVGRRSLAKDGGLSSEPVPGECIGDIGDIRSFDRALPMRIGVGGGRDCLGEPMSRSMLVDAWFDDSTSICSACRCGVWFGLVGLDTELIWSCVEKAVFSGILSGVNVPLGNPYWPKAGVTAITGRGGDRIGNWVRFGRFARKRLKSFVASLSSSMCRFLFGINVNASLKLPAAIVVSRIGLLCRTNSWSVSATRVSIVYLRE